LVLVVLDGTLVLCDAIDGTAGELGVVLPDRPDRLCGDEGGKASGLPVVVLGRADTLEGGIVGELGVAPAEAVLGVVCNIWVDGGPPAMIIREEDWVTAPGVPAMKADACAWSPIRVRVQKRKSMIAHWT
jgi:hypothetical protein